MFLQLDNKLYLNGELFCELADSMNPDQREFIFMCLELIIIEEMEIMGDNTFGQ